jgi:hypothetical protein
MMLGILANQVWQWAAWTKKERLLIKIIVVRDIAAIVRKTDGPVVGTVCLCSLQLALYGLVLPSVCGRLWTVCSVCR